MKFKLTSKFKRPFWLVPLLLYLATWGTTLFIGVLMYGNGTFWGGFAFSASLMTILSLHELGHYVQSRRYRMQASLPYFIPMPLPPLGTFGAIIKASGRFPNRKALFDVGASGPLAGLVATLIFLFVGVSLSTVQPPDENAASGLYFGEPLIFKFVAKLLLGYDSSQTLILHPMAVAAWVGLLLTTLNLFPFGQLDGGHVFYALLNSRANKISRILFAAVVVAVLIGRLWSWLVFIALVFFMKLRHPETSDDSAPLGLSRAIVGWFSLAFIIVGFVPEPLKYKEAEVQKARIEVIDASFEELNFTEPILDVESSAQDCSDARD